MRRVLAVWVLGLLVSSPGLAAGFRCGTKLVSEGDTRAEVAHKCGDPTDVLNQRSVLRRPVVWGAGRRPQYIGDDFIEVPIETWLYNLGPNKLMRQIIFEGGLVVAIETLGYGYLE